MRFLVLFLIIHFSLSTHSQSVNINNTYNYNVIRSSVLSGEFKTNFSLNIKPIDYNSFSEIIGKEFKTIIESKNESFQIKTLGIDYFVEFNSHHPYNRNNGTMIPNKGYQHLISPGLFIKLGLLEIQFKPEFHYSENKNFEGFWDGHYPEIWKKRYRLWNHIDMPERFGENSHNKSNLGQSKISLSWKNLSFGLSKENIWWGPSIRNSIMMSNHAEGFYHLTLNSKKPLKTSIGSFEFQIISGKLENSGFTPPRTDYEYAGRKLYVPKINQKSELDDWRYLQALIISYSPKIVDGLSLGFIRWVQMYSALIEGRYTWMKGNPSYFPIFKNLFRGNDASVEYESQTNQAAGFFIKWLWVDSNAEFYAEFHHNDSKQNIRDLLLDSDHSRASTLGFQKIFKIKSDELLFNWEWTQMEQSAGRLLRNAKSWYEHNWVYDGYTNKGEVLGSSIGPGSNSHYLSVSRFRNNNMVGIGLEIIDHDNDFYHEAFESAGDFRRYWKDFNFHLNFNKSYKDFNLSTNLVYVRSLNYQWELDDYTTPYYHAGRDVNNIHLSLKLTYFGSW